jgi:hypothetical protein
MPTKEIFALFSGAPQKYLLRTSAHVGGISEHDVTHTDKNTKPWVSVSPAAFNRSLLQPQVQSSLVELWIKDDALFLSLTPREDFETS